MSSPLRILMIEDDFYDAELLAYALKSDGLPHQLRRVATAPDLHTALSEYKPQVIICDFSLPGFDGFEALKITNNLAPNTPFFFSSGTIGRERVQLALKHGATGYSLKGDFASLLAQIKDHLPGADAA
ncbi:MAG: response regulator [Steroidobacteraceae bacterium]